MPEYDSVLIWGSWGVGVLRVGVLLLEDWWLHEADICRVAKNTMPKPCLCLVSRWNALEP